MHDSLLQWFAQRFLDRRLQPRELLNARKLVYISLILVLFFGSFVWRRYSVETQANQLAIMEQNRGDVELSGALMRLTLTGSRGVTTCVLWVTAIEKQKRNQWNELEFYVNALTKLQPHFITPWLFQSWNLAYNVSVESDRPFDKYFYIARGVQLLAEGERKNRDIPELRFYNGFYMQHKICVSDETNVMRSLYQLSMIPPNERDPARFRKRNENGSTDINWQEVEAFCKANPKLTRRLISGLRKDDEREHKRQFFCKDVNEFIGFLNDSWRVPSIYAEVAQTPAYGNWEVKSDTKAPIPQRFPTLPPVRDPKDIAPQTIFAPADGFEELTDRSALNDTIDAQAIARAWFGYAQEPVPPPGRLPGSNQLPEDPRRQRRPKQMSTLIWRSYPALCQTHLCQNLQQEGWFDEEGKLGYEPWELPKQSWFEPRGDRFNDGTPAAVALTASASSRQQWLHGASMWKKHGEVNHLLFKAVEEINLNQRADRYWTSHNMARFSDPLRLNEGELSVEQRERLLPEQKREILVNLAKEKLTPEERADFEAAEILYELNLYRSISNFLHHFYMAEVEGEPETALARKLFARAVTLRYQASFEPAVQTYLDPNALTAWRDKVLSVAKPEIHREYRNDSFIQEETCEVQLDYLKLMKDRFEDDIKRRLVRDLALYAFAAQNSFAHCGGFSPVPLGFALAEANNRSLPKAEYFFPKPFDILVVDQDKIPHFLATFVAANVSPGVASMEGKVGMAAQLAGLTRPLIPETVEQQVRERRKMAPEPAAQPAKPQAGTSSQ